MKLEIEVAQHISQMTEKILRPILGKKYHPIRIVLHDKAEEDFQNCFAYFRYSFVTLDVPTIAELHFMFQLYPNASDTYNYTRCGASRFIGVFVHELAHVITVLKDKNFDKENAHGKVWRKNVWKLGFDIVERKAVNWAGSTMCLTLGNKVIADNFPATDWNAQTFIGRQEAFVESNIEQLRKDFYVAK